MHRRSPASTAAGPSNCSWVLRILAALLIILMLIAAVIVPILVGASASNNTTTTTRTTTTATTQTTTTETTTTETTTTETTTTETTTTETTTTETTTTESTTTESTTTESTTTETPSEYSSFARILYDSFSFFYFLATAPGTVLTKNNSIVSEIFCLISYSNIRGCRKYRSHHDVKRVVALLQWYLRCRIEFKSTR